MNVLPPAEFQRADDYALVKSVVEAAPQPLWVIGAEGQVVLANGAASRLLGYRDPDELIGLPSHSTLHRYHPDGSPYAADDCPIIHHRASSVGRAPELFMSRNGQVVPVFWSTTTLSVPGASLLSFSASAEWGESIHRNAALEQAALDSAGMRWGIAPTRSAIRDRLRQSIRESFADPEFTPATLATTNHISIRTLQTVFATVGSSPSAEIRAVRLEFGRKLLENGCTVSRAAFESGFRDPGSFARAFRRYFGCVPSQFVRAN